MVLGETLGLVVGAVALGAIHGIEPGHGWPVAASYALDQTHQWAYGLAASLVLGIGHLVSSLAMVAVFFLAKQHFGLTQVNEPITLIGSVRIGGPVSLVAGCLLVLLGIREYRHGHSHGEATGETGHHSHGEATADHTHPHGAGSDTDTAERLQIAHDPHDHGHSHDDAHSHDDSSHSHGHSHSDGGLRARLAAMIPGGSHSHTHDDLDEAANRGLLGLAWVAFLLGFAHEEEFEIIALCAGSPYCLELMTAYALTVIAGIVGSTMLLIAGYQRYEERLDRYTPYLPAVSATVLVVMGVGFVLGVF